MDSFVFPELDRGRNGDSLEARFNAFKIPESNFLVFEATVRTCREGCQPAYCNTGSGRSEPSFGRRKREINDTLLIDSNNTLVEEEEVPGNDTAISFVGNDIKTTTKTQKPVSFISKILQDNVGVGSRERKDTTSVSSSVDTDKTSDVEDPEYVREMIEVSMNCIHKIEDNYVIFYIFTGI